MSKAPAMPMYWDAYLADTTHLTTEEHGAYMLLLAAMWRRNGWVPDDDKDNARILGLTVAKWRKIKSRLEDTISGFRIDDGRITQEKLQKIWKNTQENIAKNRSNGAKGGRPKSKKNKDIAKPNGSVSVNPNKTIPEPYPNIEANASCPEPEKSAPVACRLPLVSGDDFDVLESDVSEWCEAFPAVDVRQQLLAMRSWLNANPNKRKTPRGIKRFIVSWLDREQNRSRGSPQHRQGQPPPRQPHADSFQSAIQRRLSKAHEPDHDTERHDDTGNRGAGFAGSGPVIDLLAVSGRGGR